MTTRKRFIPRLLSLALVLLLALTMAVPAFAASGDLTITINNAAGLPDMQNEQFTAYQIFKGTANKDKESPDTNDWGATSWDNWSLADIEWGGDVITPQELITGLQSAVQDDWPEFFSEDVNVFNDVSFSPEDPADSAEKVAEILVKYKTNAFLQAFSEFVVHGKGNRGDKGAGYVTGGKKSATTDGNSSTITVDAQGYYLIAEDHQKNQGIETEFILAVLGNQTINLKADIPTVDKGIIDDANDSSPDKGDAAGVGDTVTFRLTGTVAKDIDIYNTYKYVFTDTLSKGLTYQYDARVYVVREDQKAEITEGFMISPEGPKPSPNTAPANDTTITITFDDLKKVTLADKEPNKIQGTDKIIVEYTAVLNENSVIGSTGNTNDVKLTYSNDPHSSSTGTTETTQTYVFSFGLDLQKVGSDKPDGLKGASFVLKKGEPENVQYAKFKDQWIVTKDGTKTFYDTKDAAEAAKGEGEVTGPVRRLTEWKNKKTYDSEIKDESEKLNYLLTSGDNGAIPDVYGLDAGTYALEEVVTPDGYNTMDDYKIEIIANINNETGELTSVTYKGNGADSGTTYDNNGNEEVKGVFSSGLLPDKLTNQKAPLLPFTGGIGTVIFYVLGGLLVAGAVSYLVIGSKKRKKTEETA